LAQRGPSTKQKNELLKRELLNLISSTEEQDKGLEKILQLIQPALQSDAVAAVHFDEQDHSYRLIEQFGLKKRQRQSLDSILPYISDYAIQGKKPRLPAKNNGTVLIFTEKEARRNGISSIFLYYLIKSGRIIGALVFCRNIGQFNRKSFKILDSIASLLVLLIENKFYKEKAYRIAGFVNLDGLTGLYNHRYFQENLSNELLRSQRFDYPVSLLMIDIDHFKDYNDKYSHPQGDMVLKEIARIIKETVRAYDISARYGGEEFAIILPYASQDQALLVAERIRKNVWAHIFQGKDAHDKLQMTVSTGLATYPNNAKTKADLIDRADQALYLAKSEGRNRVCLSLASSSDLIKVGFCPPAFTSSYYKDIQAGMEDVIKEIKSIELLVHAPEKESDYNMLEQIFLQFASEKPDAVAVCTQSKQAVQDLKILHKTKIPVFFFNVPEKICDPAICSYVGYDQREAGKTAGAYMARLLRGKGKIAVLEGLPEPTNQQRMAGFRKEMQAHPKISIIVSERADWMLNKARTTAARFLKQYKDLDAIFAANDEMALGAVEAAKAMKKLNKIFIIGLDGTKDALQSIRDGLLTATLNTNPREMGRILLRTIVRSLIKEEKIEGQIFSPINIVDLENVDHAMNP
jgi:diguanylate cyclase (GGDEF)-like protein